MKSLLLSALALPTLLLGAEPIPLSPPADHLVPLWPKGVPDEPKDFKIEAESTKNSKEDGSGIPILRNVSLPSLHLYRPQTVKANGTCVLVAPGGGYGILAIGHEGTDVASWLNSLGVTAAVLKYRVPRRSNEQPQLQPLQDAQRAMRLLRHHAKEWGIASDRIGMLGFSAGGNLTVFTGVSEKSAYKPIDSIDEHPTRPNFLIPIYPAYLQTGKGQLAVNALELIDAKTPPCFIAVSDDDTWSPSSANLYAALKAVGVSAEMHAYPSGGHGWGLGKAEGRSAEWPVQCAHWMRETGLLK